jgi:conjugal transfer/entry exclusion protein
MKKWFLALVLVWTLTSTGRCYLLVEDIPHLTQSIVSQVQNYAQYIQQTFNQLTQITNQVTQITNQVTSLTRFGNPSYYVNLLGLNSFMTTVGTLTSGIGQTINAYRQVTNGALALQYTGQGLYSNLTGSLDRYGYPVRYNTDAFRKFSAVNDMLESYSGQQTVYNNQMASLQQQLSQALQNLNSDSTQMGSAKYHAQIDAISAQMNALTQNMNLQGQRASMQQLANQNDAARMQEAYRQQQIQERTEDLDRFANGLGNWVGGGGALP